MLTPRIQPKESFTGQETSTAKDTGDFSVGKLLAAGAGLGLISVGSVLGEPAQAEVTSAGMYDVPKLTQLARQGGIPEKNIPQMVAIAMAESGGDPNAHNDDASTGDDSYGLWQINMIDLPNYKLGEERRKQFGIKSNEELKKPEVNVKAAKMILQGSDCLHGLLIKVRDIISILMQQNLLLRLRRKKLQHLIILRQK